MSDLKREAAIEGNVTTFMEQGKVYFWTFTFRRGTGPHEALARWALLAKSMRREWPELRGVRVIEMHPGGHGAHFHFVCNCFVQVHKLRLMASRYGFGRLHVQRWEGTARKAAEYLSKYLSKERPEELEGVRLVGGLGLRGRGTTQRDIKTYSPFKAVWSALSHYLPQFAKSPWSERVTLARHVYADWLMGDCAAEGGTIANLVKSRTIRRYDALDMELEIDAILKEQSIRAMKRREEYAKRYDAEKVNLWWAND